MKSSRAFRTNTLLRNHINTHLGVKPYKVSIINQFTDGLPVINNCFDSNLASPIKSVLVPRTRLWNGFCDIWWIDQTQKIQTHSWKTIQMYTLRLCFSRNFKIKKTFQVCLFIFRQKISHRKSWLTENTLVTRFCIWTIVLLIAKYCNGIMTH